jgi:hypothetical protein
MRDAVVVAGDLNMAVEVDAGLLPLGVLVALGRERLEGRAVERLILRAARAGQLAQRLVVEGGEQFTDGGVEFGEGEELSAAQARQDPPLDDLHADLGFRFIARPVGPGRERERAVMREAVVVGAIQQRLVAAGLAHASLQVVGDD